jgi:hypothetical protein
VLSDRRVKRVRIHDWMLVNEQPQLV